MAQSADLKFPGIGLELLEDLTPADQHGFLRLLRGRYRANYPDGTQSAPFVYDAVGRIALDAVVILAHFEAQPGVPHVYLRSALRPPLALRDLVRPPLSTAAQAGALWELPAGLVEAEEQSESGVVQSAQRELHEELGFEVELEALHGLGPSTFPAPGFVAERHFYFEVSVDPSSRGEPSLDGSALERFGVVVDVPLERALSMCRSGEIQDAKTELALRRFAEQLG